MDLLEWPEEVDVKLSSWIWPQLALSRYLKPEILTGAHCGGRLPIWDAMEVV